MPSGFTVAGVDLDSVLKPRTSTKRADVGLRIGGVDISNRYETSTGGDTIGTNTGFRVNGVDIATMFRDIAFTPGSPLSAGVDNNNPGASGTGNGPFSTATINVWAAGGTPGYSYNWTRISGDASIGISASSVSNPSWSASGTAPTTKTAVWRCTVTDGVSATATVDVTVTIIFNVSTLAVTLDTYSAFGDRTGSGSAQTDSPITGTATGGAGGYTYLWERVGGDSSTTADSPSNAATRWSRFGNPDNFYYSTWRLKVTDSLGTVAYSDQASVVLGFISDV